MVRKLSLRDTEPQDIVGKAVREAGKTPGTCGVCVFPWVNLKAAGADRLHVGMSTSGSHGSLELRKLRAANH